MNVIAKPTLKAFWEKHADAEGPLANWFKRCRKAKWRNLDELQTDYPHADVVGECTVFNVGGNKYRVITKVRYATQEIYVKHILTHAEYSKERWKSSCG